MYSFGVKLAYSIIVIDLNSEIGLMSIHKEISKYSTNMMVLNLNQKFQNGLIEYCLEFSFHKIH